MTDSVKKFWLTNWKWVVTVVFFSGLNFGFYQSSLDHKIDSDVAREIVNTELVENAFSKESGQRIEIEVTVLKTKQDYIIKTLDEIKDLLKK